MKADVLDAACPDEVSFSAGAFRDRVLQRLNAGVSPDDAGCLAQGTCLKEAGDHVLNPTIFPDPSGVKLRDAAVLIPVVDRGPQASVLLTRRTDHLASHAGQVAFPGGKIDEGDRDATHAALREAEEEIGLSADFVDPIGHLGPYLTGSGYRITPVLAYVRDGFSLRPEPGEVADIFEVPLEFLMSPGNHLKLSRQWNGARRYFYAMPYKRHYIWGVTAGILRSLYDTIYA